MTLLPQCFYARDALVVARDLLGKELRRGSVRLRISEVEAYRWPKDSANHCRFGPTPRNAPMWGEGGRVYVYLCYGLHHMLNVVTNGEGEGAAVLIRACEPIRGMALIRRRRCGCRGDGPVLLTGPGKVGAALALTTAWNGHALFEPGGLELHDAPLPVAYRCGPRVGIDYALLRDRRAHYRLALTDSLWVSHPKDLRRTHARMLP